MYTAVPQQKVSMYFCPCSCSKQDGDNEEDVLICLPRNLSYAGESYLDRYSVSSAFVHNAKLEKQLFKADVNDRYVKAGASACAEALRLQQEEDDEGEELVDQRVSDTNFLWRACAMANCQSDHEAAGAIFMGAPSEDCESTMALSTSPTITIPSNESSPTLNVTIDRDQAIDSKDITCYATSGIESPDSDIVSEEGIFVNMTDDLDAVEVANGKSNASEGSDDTYVSGDSMYYSPEELDGMDDDDHDLKTSLEEAVQQATVICLHNVRSPLPLHNGSTPDSEVQHAYGDDLSLKWKFAVAVSQSHGTESGETSETGSGDSKWAFIETNKSDSHCKYESVGLMQKVGFSNEEALTEQRKPKDNSTDLKITINDRPLHSDDKGPLSSSYRDLVSPESPLFEDREFNFRRSELRKSTSLKSTKTPPGTPRRKKVVRFADAMGLDLESVRHILNLESPPKIPASAMKDLQSGLIQERKDIGTKYIVETFPQPGADINFRERVLGQKVVLENALVVAGCITGLVRVANISFHKTVRVRSTTNDWTSFHDIAASYMLNSNDGPTDRFSFTISPPPDFGPGAKLQFAVSFNAGGMEYWDNNYGHNYVFECFAKTTPTETENSWMHFL